MELGQAERIVTAPTWGDEIEILSADRIRVAALDRLGLNHALVVLGEGSQRPV